MRKLLVGCIAIGVVGCATDGTGDGVSRASSIPRTAPPSSASPAEQDLASSTATSEKACVYRSDYVGEVTPQPGNWGTFANCYDWCPEGSFVFDVEAKIEERQGNKDDTALNVVKLHCWNPWDHPDSPYQGYITSKVPTAAYVENIRWTDIVGSSPDWGQPVKGANVQYESPRSTGGDDTAANNIKYSLLNSTQVIQAAYAPTYIGGLGSSPYNYPNYGQYNSVGFTNCPAGAAVCGLNTRVESYQGNGDDTALNGVKFACCWF